MERGRVIKGGMEGNKNGKNRHMFLDKTDLKKRGRMRERPADRQRVKATDR